MLCLRDARLDVGALFTAVRLSQQHFLTSFHSTDGISYLPSPGHEYRGSRQPRRPRESDDDDERQTDPLIADRWSSATLKVLSSMPSRTIGESVFFGSQCLFFCEKRAQMGL